MKMTTTEIKAAARKLFAEWEKAGMPGFWMEFYTAKTGFEIGSREYSVVTGMKL
jgi:hypothetical protein